jgi:histone acetyltransferase (RNA polymerase elongator complex component)
MSVILQPNDEATWLNPETEVDQLHHLLKSFHADEIEEWEVGAAARDPKNDYQKLLRHIKPASKNSSFEIKQGMHDSDIMHKTFKEFNGKNFILDEFSYFGISKSEAEKRRAMWKKSGLGARLIKKANGKYVVYREYPGV